MASVLLSRQIFMSSGSINGYTCPAGKTAIIKSIVAINESVTGSYISAYWVDSNNVGIGSSDPGRTFPLIVNGPVPTGAKLAILQDFLVIQPGDLIRLRMSGVYLNSTNVLFSIIEQDIAT